MKNILILFLLLSIDSYAQNCNSCTQTIATSFAGNITVNAGDVLCISNAGVISGSIIQNGGTVCNDGTITGNITVHDGIFSNYGTISDSNQTIIHNKGNFSNQGTINNFSITTHGNTATLNNIGSITTGNIVFDSLGMGPRPVFNNNGIIQATNLTMANADFNNDNSLSLSGNLVVGIGAAVVNDAYLLIDGNCNINSIGGYIQTNCVAQINGNFVNAGTVNGALTSCGGFNIGGTASNSSTGQIGMDNSFIDICKQGNPNGLLNSGALGPNMTQCACNNTCSASTGINRQIDNFYVSFYPNPVSEILSINSDIHFDNTEYIIYNAFGAVVQSGTINENSISVSSLNSGIYHIALIKNNQKYYVRIIKI